MKPRAYIRVSRPGEVDILMHQEENVGRYALSQGWDPPILYKEIASGGDPARDALGRLMKEVRAGDIVIFSSLSRMTRGGYAAALDILRVLETKGAGWHFVEQPILNWDSTTPKLAKDIILAVLAAVDEDYRNRISTATKRKYDQKKKAADREGVRVHWGRPKGSKDKRPRKNRSPRSLIRGLRTKYRHDSSEAP